jgi:hypothetical protein
VSDTTGSAPEALDVLEIPDELVDFLDLPGLETHGKTRRVVERLAGRTASWEIPARELPP